MTKTRTPLTRKEIQAAYRKRKTKAARDELRDLLVIAYQAGQGNPAGITPTATKLLSYTREIRELRTAAARSKRATRMLDLLYGNQTPPEGTDNT
jgi:hypothetical protein